MFRNGAGYHKRKVVSEGVILDKDFSSKCKLCLSAEACWFKTIYSCICGNPTMETRSCVEYVLVIRRYYNYAIAKYKPKVD